MSEGFSGKIATALKEAMMAKEQVKMDAIRMLKSAVKYKEIELGKALTEKDFFAVAQSLIKTRKESIETYIRGNRQELADKEKVEIEILSEFLPPQLSDDELGKLVSEAVTETLGGEKGTQKDMGRVMQVVMVKVSGRADNKKVSEFVRSKLLD